jgi:hypothetical protein
VKLRRSLIATGVPVALGLICAGQALASAARVTVRVEGAKRTLLQTTTVTPPNHGWIIKGGAPVGTCRADSAAGALNRASRGRWGGKYYTGLGVDIGTILGTRLSYSKGSYWGFYVNDRLSSTGVCDTKLTRGEALLFAPVPSRGETPLPIVVKAPRTVHAGRPFSVRTFVYKGRSSATKPVSAVHFAVVQRGGHTARFTSSQTSARGVTRLTPSGKGELSFVASAKGDIRSAAMRIKVVG